MNRAVFDNLPAVSGFRCDVCGTLVDIAGACTWQCPRASAADPRHVLSIVSRAVDVAAGDETNPFLAFRTLLAWDAFAAARGLTPVARAAQVAELDSLVAAVDGHGFRMTPFTRADALSDELGFSATGGVWVKDETGNVAGSHKARHLVSILLHLLTLERLGEIDGRPPLAIPSCGNAALAAATLAAAVSWPIQVFVPPSAAPSVLDRLASLGADVILCPRRPADPPGDPCLHRFREALAAGAVPFAVQGPANAWCLDGGRTLGWELAMQPFDRLFVQVGGGALAACAGRGLFEAGHPAVVHTVQTEGCAPLARAWNLAGVNRASAPARWSELMWPWESEPVSAADGILDDETYDWIGDFSAMERSGGSPIVAPESDVVRAHELVGRCTLIDASATGTAGLAGLLTIRTEVAADERVAVIASGIRR